MLKPQMIATLAVALSLPAALGVQRQDYEISRQTIDGGGVMSSTGGEYELSATIGQPDAGEMSGGTYTLTGGFWFGVGPGDLDADGDADLDDFALFWGCMAGPEVSTPPGGCSTQQFRKAGLDDDNDVDLNDLAEFATVFDGP